MQNTGIRLNVYCISYQTDSICTEKYQITTGHFILTLVDVAKEVSEDSAEPIIEELAMWKLIAMLRISFHYTVIDMVDQ